MAQRYSVVSLSADLAWSDGVLFNGAVAFQVVPPLDQQYTGNAGQVISKVPTIAFTSPAQKAPLWSVLPISEGKLPSNNAARIWKTSSLNPRGATYKFFLIDASGNVLSNPSGAPSGQFTVESDTYTLTLSAPTVPSNPGNPQTTQSIDDAMAIGSGSSATIPANVYSVSYTLTASSTAISYPIQRVNSLLFLTLTQDATGGRAVTYGSEFVNPVTTISTVPSASTFQVFISDGTYWRRFTTDFTA